MIVMFIDLAGFTALTEAHGDSRAMEVLDEFCGLVRAAIGRHGLHEVKTIGDAFLVTGESAKDAVLAAVSILEEISRLDEYPDVRVGIHAGDVLEREGDVMGRTVNLAARVAGEATAGQILVSKEVIAAGLPDEIDPVALGPRWLRHVHQEVELYQVTIGSTERPVDPVCHMTIQPARLCATYNYEGKTYHFCSDECLLRFLADPATFVEPGPPG